MNELIRAGLAQRSPAKKYDHQVFSIGLRVDVSNVGDLLDLLDQWDTARSPWMLVDATTCCCTPPMLTVRTMTLQRPWLSGVLDGDRRVGVPWQSLAAFIRISTHPRISANPLSIDQAWTVVEGWLNVPTCWQPNPGSGYGRILGQVLRSHHAGGNLVPDAQLAALAIEHGLRVFSADSDFARFTGLTWVNPLR